MKKSPLLDKCAVATVHYDKLEKAKSDLIPENRVIILSDFFKVFSDPTRLKILMLLAHNELCVCDIMEALNLKQSTVSQQLRSLRQMRLVKHYQDGKQVFYSLDDDHIYKILIMGIEHIEEERS